MGEELQDCIRGSWVALLEGSGFPLALGFSYQLYKDSQRAGRTLAAPE